MLNKKLERFIDMQKAKHINGKFMIDLEQNINDFIEVFEVDVKLISITFDPIMENFNAMIIYEDK